MWKDMTRGTTREQHGEHLPEATEHASARGPGSRWPWPRSVRVESRPSLTLQMPLGGPNLKDVLFILDAVPPGPVVEVSASGSQNVT